MPSTPEDDVLDPGDLAPAVLCARCGRSECAGCTPASRGPPASAPWERLELGYFQRLWWTARDTTLAGETFFAGLAAGRVAPALAFAVTSELLAIGSFGAAYALGAHLVLPSLLPDFFAAGPSSGTLLVWMTGVVAGLSAVMVGLHVLWGVSLELGMRLQGSTPRGVNCLRYALYSCGWDLLTSPFGLAMACAASGPAGGVSAVGAAVRVPRIATRAYLSTARELDPGATRRAVLIATFVTGSVVLVGTLGAAVAAVVAFV